MKSAPPGDLPSSSVTSIRLWHPVLVDRELGILGAGASGLSLALLASRSLAVLEREERPGGHAASRSIDGWVFDQGPHVMFSKDELLIRCMVGSLGDNVHRSRRNNKVALAGTLARYPVENDLAALPLPLRSEALLGMLRARGREHAPSNLAEWFVANFGDELVELYFRPYNEKLWKIPLEHLSMSWAERIPQPPVEDVVRGALGEVSEGYLHQLMYSYPLHGGYSAIMDAWAAGLAAGELHLGQEVTAVEPHEDGIRIHAGGGKWNFREVVSTIPLHRLLTMVPEVPEEIVSAAGRLVVNPIIIATLGFSGSDPNQYTAVYIPDRDYLVNRVSWPAVFSPNNAPPGCFSVQAEITCAPAAEVLSWSDDAIAEHVLEGLRARGLVPAGAADVFRWVERFEFGYVVYTTGYEADVRIVKDWFKGRGIILHGRFGSHDYLNVDGCLRSSIDLARAMGGTVSDAEILERFERLALARA